MPLARLWPILVLAALVWVAALAGARPQGDGGEYLLMAHALGTHATPDIRLDDAEWLRTREPRLERVARKLVHGLRHHELTPLAAVRRSERGAYFPLHFWLYSLLAVPPLWLTEALDMAPSAALLAVNALASTFALCLLWLHFERTRFGLVAAAVFVLSGTTFYLGWTGPEALTGAAVVGSCLAARRGELGLASVGAALAAAQNPSTLALVPFATAHFLLQHRTLRRKDVGLLVFAAVLAVLPYAFFYVEFDLPSPLGRFAADPRLIGFERAWSLVFDLDQGLVYGMPGALFAFASAAVLALRLLPNSARAPAARDTALTLLLVSVMSLPTLGVHNWNAGCSVFIRYGYWLTLPLLVLAFELLAVLPLRPRCVVLGVTVALGIGVMAGNGVVGQRYRYLGHTWLARFVLRHAPGAYNPEPEIFYERTLGAELPMTKPAPVIWPTHGAPLKLLAPADVPTRSERICPDGGEIQRDHAHAAGGDWLYLDAPFRCAPHAT
jgi:hypothetical protein